MDPEELTIRIVYMTYMTALLVVTAAGASVLAYASRFEKRAQHTSKLSGEQWIQEMLQGHEGRIHNELGMHKAVFIQLLTVLKRDAGVHATRYVSAEEQLATFLHYVHRGLPNRALQERFQRSGDTISKCVVINIQRSGILIKICI
jgi:transposase